MASKTDSPITVSSAKQWIGGALVLVPALLTVVAINIRVSTLRVEGQPLPEYATWTGIPPLDQKLRFLGEFANQGPVDAIVIGSSISDHGVSAAVLSRDLSAAYGRPFRVFNLSTGGAEVSTILMLYRLAVAIAKPKQIWVCFPVEKNTVEDYDLNSRSPDYTLLHAPAGIGLRYPLLLPLFFRLFQLPLIRHATALHDLAFYGKYAHRPVSHLDVYDNDAYGDTRGFLYYSGAEPFAKYVDNRRRFVLLLASQYSAAHDERTQAETYFSRSALNTLSVMQALSARDNRTITILAHDTVAGFASQDVEYLSASKKFYEVLSRRLGAPVIDVHESFHLASYNFADTSHLNSNGADEISELMAARIANRPWPERSSYAIARDQDQRATDPRLTPYTAVILQRGSDPSAGLRLQYVQSQAVLPVLPHSRVQIVALMPNNRTITVPASIVSRGEVLADTSALPTQAAGRALLIQLTPASAKWGDWPSPPLSSYRWVAQSHEQTRGALAKVFGVAASYTPLDHIRVSWEGIDDPSPKDWIGVFPVGGGQDTELSRQWTGGHAAGAVEISPNPTALTGQYELRLYANDGWDLRASSKPFLIIGPPGTKLDSASNGNLTSGRGSSEFPKEKPPPVVTKFLNLFERLRAAEPLQNVVETARGSKVAFLLTDAEINDYMRYSLKVKPRPGLDSMTVTIFKYNYVSTFTMVDFDAVERWRPGTIPVLLRTVLTGKRAVLVDYRLHADHSKMTFSVEKAYYQNIRLPAFFVQKAIEIVAARQREQYDTSKPLPIPFGLKHVWTSDHVIQGEN